MNQENARIPLQEFDEDTKAVIEPGNVITGKAASEYCVMTFFGRVIRKLEAERKLEIVRSLFLSAPFTCPSYIYSLKYKGKTLMVIHPGIGAALAAGGFEEMIALGCRKFVACGSSGVLHSHIETASIVVVESAVRDEGTSFHYCSPSREISADKAVVKKLEKVLQNHKINYATGKTWTTDGFYRETRGRVAKRAAEGCITVDMEASALLAVAAFRKVTFGQYLMALDDVSGENWDTRFSGDRLAADEKVFWLSVEACLEL